MGGMGTVGGIVIGVDQDFVCCLVCWWLRIGFWWDSAIDFVVPGASREASVLALLVLYIMARCDCALRGPRTNRQGFLHDSRD